MKLYNKVIFSIQIGQITEIISNYRPCFIMQNVFQNFCIDLRNFKKVFTALKDSTVVPPCGLFKYSLKIENYFFLSFCFTNISVF